MALFGLGKLEHIPPPKKTNAFQGVGGRIMGAISHIFGAKNSKGCNFLLESPIFALFFLNWSIFPEETEGV